MPLTHHAHYLGRVQQVVSEQGMLLALLWEWPSGQEVLAELRLQDLLPGNGEPVEGDLLLVHTWVELPGGGQQNLRCEVEIRRRTLSEQERAELLALLQEEDEEGP